MPSEVKDYEVLCTIGAGSCGTCKKIRRLRDGKILVWKELDYSSASDSEKQMLVSEVNLLRELKHEHIVRYVDRIIDRKHSMLYLVMEFCEGGDLASFISKLKKDSIQVEESFVWRVCYQLTLAINECHSRSRKDRRSVMHRDLKPANIFLDSNLNVKLGDFGLARVLSHETSFSKTYVGTPLYMSPEQMSGTAYNEKSDIWSLGCVLYELCALHPPFLAGTQLELATRICSGRFPRIPSNYSDELHSFISSLIQLELDKRPSIDCLLNNVNLLKHVVLVNLETPSSSGHDEEAYGKRLEMIKKREEEILVRELALNKRKDEIDVRQQELEKRSQELEKRIQEMGVREMNLTVRERLAEDRLSRAERMMHVYVEAKTKLESKGSGPVRTTPSTGIQRRLSSPSVCLESPSRSPNNAVANQSRAVTPKGKSYWSHLLKSPRTSPGLLRDRENLSTGNEILYPYSDGQRENLERNTKHKIKPPHIYMSKMFDVKNSAARQVAERQDRKPLGRLDQQILPPKILSGSPVISKNKVR